MIRKYLLFIILYLKDKDYIKAMNLLTETNKMTKEEMEEYQRKRVKILVNHAYNNVRYYRRIFDENNIHPRMINTIKDLEKLPVLTKKDIINNYEDIQIKSFEGKYSSTKTGGSTGQTLEYINSNFDLRLSTILLLNGYKYAGYEYGDHVVTIGGSSVVKKNTIKAKLKTFFIDFTFNFKSFSTEKTDEKNFNNIISHMNKKKYKFLRGYKSSIYLLAKYIEDNNIRLKENTQAVFTTSEKLLDSQREVIERAFKCKVFDQYGLNDGGISAFQNIDGEYLIDFERSIIEVVDGNNQQIENIEGRILGTSLYNFHMPFIRYDSEDLGIKNRNQQGKDFLIEITGKSNDILSFNNNLNITPVLNQILRRYELSNYQVIKTNNIISINMVADSPGEIEESLSKELETKLKGIPFSLNFVLEKDFYVHPNGKHKYIIDLSKE